MRRSIDRRLRLALAALALLGAGGSGAEAQFVWPWNRQPAAPSPVPPAAVPATPDPTQPPPVRAAPPPPRPVAPRAISEAGIVGRVLRLGGASGQLRVDRAAKSALEARLVLSGTKLSNPAEPCEVRLETPLPVSPRGRPDGLARFEIAAPSCPIVADMLEGALWVREPGEPCRIETADCRIDPRGLWGPEAAALMNGTGTIERERGLADQAVRENYKILAQRAKPQDVRAIVGEQASFSAERETACRGYASESAHGFCNARFTEARAAALAARLGVAPATAAAGPVAGPAAGIATPAATPTPRRPSPVQPPPLPLSGN